MATIPKSAVADALAELEQPYTRPSPIEWLKYAVLARSPEHCRTWVLHDVTCRTWVLRHASRAAILLITPVLVALFLLPTPLHIRLLIVANAGFPSFLGGMLFVLPATERRLVYAGYPGELGQAIRHTRAVEKQTTANRARRERMAERRERRWGQG